MVDEKLNRDLDPVESESILDRIQALLGGKKQEQTERRYVHVIINPASGKDQAILRTINFACNTAGIDWDVYITKKSGDGRRLAEQAVKAGVDRVLVYGGDGTVMEVASGLLGSDIPMAILPGGTANVLAIDLGIPRDLVEASALAVDLDSNIRIIDVAQIGDRYFVLRAGLGLEAAMVAGAKRELKERFGVFAYALSALQALADPVVANYQLSFEGQEVDAQGLTCIIANSGLMGMEGLYLAPDIQVDDGLLDVIVLRRADLPSLLSLAASVVEGEENQQALQRWQVREVTVHSQPTQKVQVDGEMIEQTPVNIKVIPQAVPVVVPFDKS
ncbi:MAG TPA: diacylglycerol kinase family protein [Anaerolineales bacterium]